MNNQIPDNVSEHTDSIILVIDYPCIGVKFYGEKTPKKKENKEERKKRQPALQERNRRKERAKQAGGLSHPLHQKQNIPRPEPASWERQRRKLGR